MEGLCESNFSKVFLGLNEIPSSHMKIDNLFILSQSIFLHFGFISPSIFKVEKATIYRNNAIVIRNLQKLTVLFPLLLYPS